MELDDEEHEEGWGRQKKRDRKSKERTLEGKQAAVENGWWIKHKRDINHRTEEDDIPETDAQGKKKPIWSINYPQTSVWNLIMASPSTWRWFLRSADQLISTTICGCPGWFAHPEHPGRQIPQLISDNNKQLVCGSFHSLGGYLHSVQQVDRGIILLRQWRSGLQQNNCWQGTTWNVWEQDERTVSKSDIQQLWGWLPENVFSASRLLPFGKLI